VERFEGWLARRAFHRRVRAAPRTAIRDLDDGALARITGRVVTLDGQTLAAPFTGKPCVYFSVSTMFHGSPPQLFGSNQQGVPFLLVSGDHRAVVEPDHARMSLGTHHRTRSPATHFMYRQNMNGYIERRESVIAPGDELVIVGVGIGEPDPERPPSALFRGTTARRFRFTGSEDAPLLVSDEPGLFSTD
jgi:hypothetical protein